MSSDFFTQSTVAPAGDEVALMNCLERFSSGNSWMANHARQDTLYSGPKGWSIPSFRMMAWSYFRRSWRSEATGLENNGRNSWNSGGTIVRTSLTGALVARACLRSVRETGNISGSFFLVRDMNAAAPIIVMADLRQRGQN